MEVITRASLWHTVIKSNLGLYRLTHSSLKVHNDRSSIFSSHVRLIVGIRDVPVWTQHRLLNNNDALVMKLVDYPMDQRRWNLKIELIGDIEDLYDLIFYVIR